MIKRAVRLGDNGAEARFVVSFERWGWTWRGAGIEFWTDSEQMGRRESVSGRDFLGADRARAYEAGPGWER